MIEISREREVPGAREDVAALVCDLERWPEWFVLHKGWIGEVPSEAEIGLRFRHKVRALGIPGEVTWEITDLDVPARFAARGKGTSGAKMEVDFRIWERDGGSCVAFTAKIGGFALRPLKGQLEPWLGTRADRSLDRLSALLAET